MAHPQISHHETRIAVLSDIHISTDASAEAAERRLRLASAIEAVNAESPDLVVIPGDLTEHGDHGELEEFGRLVQRLRPPVAWVPGNHDVGDKWLPDKPGITPERIRAYEAALGSARISRRVGRLYVLGVNASLMGSGLEEERSQWEWLENALRQSSADQRLMALHYPPYREDAAEPAGDYWTLETEPRSRLLSLARAHGVRLILSGHLHSPKASSYDGIALLTAPSVAFGLPIGVQPHGWMMVTINASGKVRSDLRYPSGELTSSPPE